MTTNGDDLFGHNVTGGANGLLRVDPLSFFGHALPVEHSGIFSVAYLYVVLAVFVVVYVALRFVNHSRTGRAWRSLREDPLAAEVMGMPVNWLKLMSFAFGAAVAALSGTFVAALNASVFPLSFSFPLLITIYTMVILGGAGSQAGVVLGAILVSVLLELLRDPGDSRVLFYCVVVARAASRRSGSRRGSLRRCGGVARVRGRRPRDRRRDRRRLGQRQRRRGRRRGRLRRELGRRPAHPRRGSRPSSYISLVAAGAASSRCCTGWVRLALLVPCSTSPHSSGRT